MALSVGIPPEEWYCYGDNPHKWETCETEYRQGYAGGIDSTRVRSVYCKTCLKMRIL